MKKPLRVFPAFVLFLALAFSLLGCDPVPLGGVPPMEPSRGSPPAAFAVTFDKNGGDAEASPAAKTVTAPATTVGTLPEPPTRSGWSFDGWNMQADGTGTAFDAGTEVTANITVYAQWAATAYTVTLVTVYFIQFT